jgi:hypothetical protein
VTGRSVHAGSPAAAVLATIDRRFVLHAALWTAASLLAFGLIAAIIPNPVFGRQIPPEPFAIAVWLVSAPLLGVLGATYSAPAVPPGATSVLAAEPIAFVREPAGATPREGTVLGTAAGIGAFFAIGCPVCNKVALILLGTSGAMTVFAPLQPVIGAVSLALLAGTLAWRLRLRVRGGACSV